MDYYKILEITKEASDKDIKSSYKKLALKWHPDRNPDNKHEAEEKFKKISQAYQVLSDLEKRKKYDLCGNNESNYHFQHPQDVFKNFFRDIPLEYIELANTFILNFIDSPECNLSCKIFCNMPNKENIISVLEIFKEDCPEDTKIALEKYITKLKNTQKNNQDNTVLDIATNYAFSIFNNKMKIYKKSIKKKKIKLIENVEYF